MTSDARARPSLLGRIELMLLRRRILRTHGVWWQRASDGKVFYGRAAVAEIRKLADRMEASLGR